VDPETQQYFAEINELVGEGGGTVEDPEERAIVIANALDEARGKELQLACHSSCGRVLEALLMNSDTLNAAMFLERCTEVFAAMSLDPGGSHVAEAALKAVAFALQGSNVRSQEWYPVVERTLSRICEVG
jgi:nucleolar protein 9